MDVQQIRDKAQDCPTAWFAAMERAIDAGDLQTAAAAQAELKRLGYTVKPQKPKAVRRAR